MHDLVWNRAGRVRAWDQYGAQTTPAIRTFDYDFAGQLLRAEDLFSFLGDGAWQYDAAGARRDNDPGSYHHYDVGSNSQQATSPDWVLAWVAAGRLDKRYRRAAGGSQGALESAYTWDHRGRLQKVQQYNASGVLAQTIHFQYDALDRRARQTVVSAGGATMLAGALYVQLRRAGRGL